MTSSLENGGEDGIGYPQTIAAFYRWLGNRMGSPHEPGVIQASSPKDGGAGRV